MSQVEELILLCLHVKTDYIATTTKTVWYWNRVRHIYLWIINESPEVNLHIYGQLVLYNSAKIIQWRKNIILNKWCWYN